MRGTALFGLFSAAAVSVATLSAHAQVAQRTCFGHAATTWERRELGRGWQRHTERRSGPQPPRRGSTPRREGADLLFGGPEADDLDGGSGASMNDGGAAADRRVNPDAAGGALNCETTALRVGGR